MPNSSLQSFYLYLSYPHPSFSSNPSYLVQPSLVSNSKLARSFLSLKFLIVSMAETQNCENAHFCYEVHQLSVEAASMILTFLHIYLRIDQIMRQFHLLLAALDRNPNSLALAGYVPFLLFYYTPLGFFFPFDQSLEKVCNLLCTCFEIIWVSRVFPNFQYICVLVLLYWLLSSVLFIVWDFQVPFLVLLIVRTFSDRNFYLGLLGFSVTEFPHLCAL